MAEFILPASDRRSFARMVAQTWSDDSLTARYNAEPRAVLAEFGIHLAEDVPTPVLPSRPGGEFSVEQLEAVAGGAVATAACIGCVSCPAGSTGTFGNVTPEAQ
jgi:putative thiazole/oxazole-modified microcin (TOMM)-like peptide